MRIQSGSAFPVKYIGRHDPYAPHRSHLTLRKQGDLITAIINRKEVLRFRDNAPIDVGRVGIGGHHTRINFSDIEIVELPRKQ